MNNNDKLFNEIRRKIDELAAQNVPRDLMTLRINEHTLEILGAKECTAPKEFISFCGVLIDVVPDEELPTITHNNIWYEVEKKRMGAAPGSILQIPIKDYVNGEFSKVILEGAPIGKKYDVGKPRLAEMIQDFRNPLIEVARVWGFGAEKYEKGNWRYVLGGQDRYTNAMLRHLCAEADDLKDDESELLHAAHVAWNALARLQFILDQQKENKHE